MLWNSFSMLLDVLRTKCAAQLNSQFKKERERDDGNEEETRMHDHNSLGLGSNKRYKAHKCIHIYIYNNIDEFIIILILLIEYN